MINMEDQIEIRNGWFWPKSDIGCWQYLNTYFDVPKKCSSFVSDKSVVVQAGGNCGFYVKQYAEIFKHVYTFEPNELNFFCLNKNISMHNVIKFQSCLGADNNLVSLRNRKNVGRHSVDTDSGYNYIPTLTIDNLGLSKCNLIHLDIEGYELFALHGAINTIERCKPTIVLESVDNNKKFDYSNDDVVKYLQQFDYKIVDQIYTDIVFQI